MLRFPQFDEDPELEPEDMEFLDSSTGRDHKVKTSRRPMRSVLYYMKGYESSISLTPVQLPPRSRVVQVSMHEFMKKVTSRGHVVCRLRNHEGCMLPLLNQKVAKYTFVL